MRTLRVLIGQTRDEVHDTRSLLSGQIQVLASAVERQPSELSAVRDGIQSLLESRQAELTAQRAAQEQVMELLRFVHEAGHRRRERLRELRASPSYEEPFLAPNPLVSVVISTYDNHDLLYDRAIPSVLAQTYQNLEVVVVGDAAAEQARLAVESFGDPRIRYYNRQYRGPYPEDPLKRWLVAGVPAYNAAVQRAEGSWLAPLDDDDSMRPEHIERLLGQAREHRLEMCYGRLSCHYPDGSTSVIGRFPPELGHFGLQAAIYHRGLASIFELELADAALGLPYDWGLCLRMLEADVRIGMLDEDVVDYYPSRSWRPRFSEPGGGAEARSDGADTSAPREQAQPAPEWEYAPEGWGRVVHGTDEQGGGWRDDAVARAYQRKWPLFLEAIAGEGPLGASHEVPENHTIDRDDVVQQNAVLAFAYAISRAAMGRDRLSALDWGGALGHYYLFARRLFPDLHLDYHCRELPAVAAAGRALLPEVTFHDTDQCFQRRYGLVLASNSLQYVERWRDLLLQLTGAAERWLFLSRVPLTAEHSSFVVLQRAYAYGYESEYLGWVFNRQELLLAARDAGLALERELALRGNWPIQGAPAEASQAAFLLRVVART
jgi:putative methyltransferase (TIGR04325 family)